MTTSPLNCIQEIVPTDEHYPWRVMFTCILLNQTHGRQVRPILDRLWQLLPEPRALLEMGSDDFVKLQELLRPLGFINKRLYALKRMTLDYDRGIPYEQCYGMGKYGRDAIAIFVHGSTEVEPTDTWLVPYLEWRRSGGPPVQWKKERESA